jgi:hypothetical protein
MSPWAVFIAGGAVGGLTVGSIPLAIAADGLMAGHASGAGALGRITRTIAPRRVRAHRVRYQAAFLQGCWPGP